MTHKNPELRKQHTAVPFVKKESAGHKSVASSVAKKPVKKLPPKMELEGKKWIVVSSNFSVKSLCTPRDIYSVFRFICVENHHKSPTAPNNGSIQYMQKFLRIIE